MPTRVIPFEQGNAFDMNAYINTIIMGDCLTVMKSMPAQSVDVIVTSPPL